MAEARSWVGTPFQHQGRMKQVGVDCIGLVICCAAKTGIALAKRYEADPNTRRYRERPARYALLAELQRACRQVPKEDAKPGDLLCMIVVDNPQHVLLLDHGGMAIHAAAMLGVSRVVRHRIPPAWWSRSTAFVLPGLD